MKTSLSQFFSGFHQPDFRIRFVSFFLLVGWASFFFFYYTHHVFFPGSPMPMSFHFPANLFCDFFTPYSQHCQFNLASPSNYFPFASVIFGVFRKLFGDNILQAVFYGILGSSIFLVSLAYQFLTHLPKPEKLIHAFILSLCTFPFFFNFHTANLEIWVFLLIGLAFFLQIKNRKILAAVVLAAAAAIKGYPGIFLIFFIQRKEYRATLAFFVALTLLTLLPFFYWHTSVHDYLITFGKGMANYRESMIVQGQGSRFGHSLMNTTRVLFPTLHGHWVQFLNVHYLVSLSVLAFFSYHTWVVEKTLWKQALIWVSLACLLPPTSTDYKLLLFLVPFLLYCLENKKSRFDIIYTVGFALLFINKGYVYFGDLYMTLNAVSNTFLMLFLLTVVLIERLPFFRLKEAQV